MDLVSKHESGGQRDADVLGVEFLDHNAADWSRIRRSVYDVQQRFHYEYAAPISELRQRLVVVPRPVHGNQRLLSHRLEVSEARFRRRMRADRFGNVVLQISIPKVEEAVGFDVSLIVERSSGQGPHLEAATTQALDAYLMPSALTRPDAGAARRVSRGCGERREGRRSTASLWPASASVCSPRVSVSCSTNTPLAPSVVFALVGPRPVVRDTARTTVFEMVTPTTYDRNDISGRGATERQRRDERKGAVAWPLGLRPQRALGSCAARDG